MTTLATPPSNMSPGPAPTLAAGDSLARSQLIQKTRLYTILMLMMAPTMLGLLLFTYYPSFSTIKYSFFMWDGQATEEFRGIQNYQNVFIRDPLFWQSFTLVGILLAANLIKMVPSILTAVVMHRLKSERWQYIYRVLFVIPMIIPALVGLLIWKSFYDPNVGILNPLLRSLGLMPVLQYMDGKMPELAVTLSAVLKYTVDPVFGSVWGLLAVAVMIFASAGGIKTFARRGFIWGIIVIASCFIFDPIRMALFITLALVLGEVLQNIKGRASQDTMVIIGMIVAMIGAVLVLLTKAWPVPTHAFDTPQPNWLGHTNLIIPSLIFWGFPWVGTVGVLIYLAGLQNISHDVYEAAALDGVSSIGRFFRIELPLMLTQVRINLIFMTIGTLGDYGLVLLLLGPDGGPGNKGMNPGLYMYKKAFLDGEFGYACAQGMIMFVLILAITVFYQKYVKVEK